MKSDLLPQAVFLFLLSFADAFFTWIGVKDGLIEEANPLMDHLLGFSATAFFLVKLALPLLLIVLVPRLNGSLIFRVSLLVAVISYTSVFLLHAAWISMM